jgi:hypothetical protein
LVKEISSGAATEEGFVVKSVTGVSAETPEIRRNIPILKNQNENFVKIYFNPIIINAGYTHRLIINIIF